MDTGLVHLNSGSHAPEPVKPLLPGDNTFTLLDLIFASHRQVVIQIDQNILSFMLTDKTKYTGQSLFLNHSVHCCL